jgi:hypothetical protein
MFRRWNLILLALAVGLSAALSVTPAEAATDTITFVSAGSPASDVGALSVVADSTTPITSLSVHLLNSSGTDVLDPAMSQASQTTTSDGYQSTWTVTTAITQSALALGSYTISVDAADAGTSVTGVDAGTLAFVDEPTITFAASATTVDYANPTVTLSGTASLTAPDGTVSPYSGPIVLTLGYGTTTVTADASGNYSTTYTPTFDGSWAYATIAATSTTGSASSTEAYFTIHQDPLKLTAKLSTASVADGGAATVSGVLTYLPDTAGATYQPVVGYKVYAYTAQDPQTPAASGTSGNNGSYSITLPTTESTDWTVAAGSGGELPNTIPYFGLTESQPLPMSVNLPTSITGLNVSLNQYWQLSFSGCLNNGAEGDASTGSLVAQYADSAKGPWYKLGSSISTGGACGSHGIRFSGSATAATNYAYYRVMFTGAAGSGPNQTYGLLSSASSASLVWKYYDRIAGFSVSTRVVNAHGKLTVRGTLQYYYSGYHAYKNQLIWILLRPKGSGTWYWEVKVHTNGIGYFSATFTDPVSATWEAAFYGNGAHLECGSAEIYVRLKG